MCSLDFVDIHVTAQVPALELIFFFFAPCVAPSIFLKELRRYGETTYVVVSMSRLLYHGPDICEATSR